MNDSGKRVLITGGATGIGLAVAARFLREGARVAICGRRLHMLRAAERFLRKTAAVDNGQFMRTIADMSLLGDVAKVTEGVRSRWGGLDILVNNAGRFDEKPIGRISERDYYEVVDGNFKTVVLCTNAAVGCMRANGAIINVGSYAALMGSGGSSLYAASKAAVLAFTRVAAAELAARKIRVNCVLPGVIATPMVRRAIRKRRSALLRPIAMGRFGTADEVADAVFFLSGESARYITGAALEVTGGKYAAQTA